MAGSAKPDDDDAAIAKALASVGGGKPGLAENPYAPTNNFEAGLLGAGNYLTGGNLPSVAGFLAPIPRFLDKNVVAPARDALNLTTDDERAQREAVEKTPMTRDIMVDSILKGKASHPWSTSIGETIPKIPLAAYLGPRAFAGPGGLASMAGGAAGGFGSGVIQNVSEYLQGTKTGGEAVGGSVLDTLTGGAGGPIGNIAGRIASPAKYLVASAYKQLPEGIQTAASGIADTMSRLGGKLSTSQSVKGGGLLESNPVARAEGSNVGTQIDDATRAIAKKTPAATTAYNTYTKELSGATQEAAEDWMTKALPTIKASEAQAPGKIPVYGIGTRANDALKNANVAVKSGGMAQGDSPIAIHMAKQTLQKDLAAATDDATRAEIQDGLNKLNGLLDKKAPDFRAGQAAKAEQPKVTAGQEAAQEGNKVIPNWFETVKNEVPWWLPSAAAFQFGGGGAGATTAAVTGAARLAKAGADKLVSNRGAEDAVKLLLTDPDAAMKLFGKKTLAQLYGERGGIAATQAAVPLLAQNPTLRDWAR